MVAGTSPLLPEDPAVKNLGTSAEGCGTVLFCTRQLDYLCQCAAILGREAKSPNSSPSCFVLRPRFFSAVELLFQRHLIFY